MFQHRPKRTSTHWTCRWLAWITVSALPLASGCGQGPAPPEATSVVAATDPSVVQADFSRVADELRSGDNPYHGLARRGALERAVLEAPDDHRRVTLLADLTTEHLELGDEEAALGVVEEAMRLARGLGDADTFARLHRLRGLVHMRRAEVRNCVREHNAKCCLFPLEGAGVHGDPRPAQLALEDYRVWLEHTPDDLGTRWLVNVAAMAAGVHPEGVPDDLRISVPSRDESWNVSFVDVAPDNGLDTVDLCGGVAVADFDGDGRLDVVTSTSDPTGPLRLWRATANGWEDASKAAGTSVQLGGLNCVAADYDGDGDPDILVLRGAWMNEDGRIRNSLLRNDGAGGFADVTEAAGLAHPARPTQAACFGDFDLDGDLDLYIGNESGIRSSGQGDHPCQLFRNEGDGTFTDVTEVAGVSNDGFCKGVAAGDWDNDGDLDLYVSNVGINRLYRNEGGMRFTEVARLHGVELPHRTFACWFFDYDNDGWLDLFVASYDATTADVAADHLGQRFKAHPPALFKNERGRFRDVTEEVGLGRPFAPMGANFGDPDGDGWLDVYLATGGPAYDALMPNVLLRNEGGRRFVDVTTAAGLGHLQKGHGVAFADLDDDGDQDLFHQLGGFYPGDAYANALFRNPGHGHRWLTLELEGSVSPRSGHGARIRVVVDTANGTREVHRAVGSVSSFGGSPIRQEIGLGDALSIRRLEVAWPVSRRRQVFDSVALDRVYRVAEDVAELGEPEPRR